MKPTELTNEIDKMTFSKATKNKGMIYLRKIWKEVRESVYVSGSTLRIDNVIGKDFDKLKALLNLEINDSSLTIQAANKKQLDELVQVFLNDNLSYKLSGSASEIRSSNTYTKRKKALEKIDL